MTCKKCGAEITSSASFCEYCGAKVEQSTERAYTEAPATSHPAAQAILDQPVAAYNAPAVEEQPKKKNFLLGILGALIGAAIGMVSIVLVSRMGYVASLCGVLLAFCTIKGYELLGGKPGIPGLVVCVGLIVIAPYLANHISLALEIMDIFYGATFSQAFVAVPHMLAEGSIDSGAYWGNLGQLYLFTAIGGVSIIWNAFKNK